MRAYLELARASFRRYSSYRLAVVAGVVTQSVFGFIRVSVLFAAIGAAGGTLAGYDDRTVATYVWLGQAMLAAVALFGSTELADRVSSGEIAVDLSRPVDLLAAYWASDLGRAVFQLLARGLPPLLIGALTVGLALPGSWTAYPLGVLSLFLGISISFLIRFAVNLIAFWALDARGFVGLQFVFAGPLSGLYVPVHLFPDWLRTIAYATPFPASFQTPIDVLSGRALGPDALLLIAAQLGWIVGLVVADPDRPLPGDPAAGGAGWVSTMSERGAELSAARSYAILVGSRIRSQYAYRTSFWLTTATSVGIGVIEFLEIYVILANVPVFGGLDFAQASLVFALANMGFSLADMVFGQFDSMPNHLRLGRLEVMLVRPMPLMAQLVTSDFQLRRVGRVAVGALIMVLALLALQLPLTPERVYLLIITPLIGGAIYGALFVLAGGLQFFLVDGTEFTNSFVYGGAYAGQLPGSVLITPVRILFTFVIPATVAAYLPSLLILGLPGPAGLPSWLGWLAPLFAAWIWLLAMLAWRAGIGKFTGAGG